jgi:hypothetical protein
MEIVGAGPAVTFPGALFHLESPRIKSSLLVQLFTLASCLFFLDTKTRNTYGLSHPFTMEKGRRTQ